jgi:hypothetical protein
VFLVVDHPVNDIQQSVVLVIEYYFITAVFYMYMCVNSFPVRIKFKKRTYLLNNILIINRFEYTFFTCFLNFSTQNKFIKDKISFFKIKNYIKFTNLFIHKILHKIAQQRFTYTSKIFI